MEYHGFLKKPHASRAKRLQQKSNEIRPIGQTCRASHVLCATHLLQHPWVHGTLPEKIFKRPPGCHAEIQAKNTRPTYQHLLEKRLWTSEVLRIEYKMLRKRHLLHHLTGRWKNAELRSRSYRKCVHGNDNFHPTGPTAIIEI